MASSVKFASNSSNTVDERYATKTLKVIDDLLIDLKKIHPSGIPSSLKSKFYCMYEKLGYLLIYWDMYDKNILSTIDKIDESLWLDNAVFKFLYDDCITYSKNKSSGTRDLYCDICESSFECNSSSLMNHLSNDKHLSWFKMVNSQRKLAIWKNIDVYKWAFKKFIDFRPDKTIYCKLCGVSITLAQSNLVSHLEGVKHMRNFSGLVNLKYVTENDNILKVNKKKLISNSVQVDKELDNDTVSRNNISKSHIKTNALVCKETNLKVNVSSKEKSKNCGSVTSFKYFDPYAETEVPQGIKSKNKPIDKSENKRVTKKSCTEIESHISVNFCEKDEKKINRRKSENYINRNNSCHPDSNVIINNKAMTIKDVESHGLFLNKVVVSNPSGIKFYCQPCGYVELFSSVDEIKNHVMSLKHRQYTDLKRNLAFINYYSYNCEICNIEFFCSEDFILYHDKSKQHKSMYGNGSKHDIVKKEHQNADQSSLSPFDKTLPKNVPKDILMSDMEIFGREMKLLLKNLLKNTDTKTVTENECYGYFCNACNYWTKKAAKWSPHIDSVNHKQNMTYEKKYKVCICDCCITLICDDNFYSKHLSSYEHRNLKYFISKKSSSNDSDFSKKVSVRDSSSMDNRIQSEHTEKLVKSFFAFQLSGLTATITEDDICKAFSSSGKIEYVDFVGGDLAEVYIALREDISVSDVDGYTKQGLQIPVANSSCQLKPKSKCVPPEEIKINFSKNRHVFIEKLIDSSTKECASSFISVDEKIVLKTDVVKEDIMKVCKKVKNVKIVGSRVSGLAQPDSELDLCIILDYNDSATNINTDDFLLLLRGIENELINFPCPLFKNVTFDGDIITAEHISTELKCKMFCNHHLIVVNTEVIRLYVNTDERVKHLILIIKEWIKEIDFSQTVSNYTVTWMVLYYLMQTSVNLVKPVSVLLDKCSEERMVIGGWDCTLRKNIMEQDLLGSDSNFASLDELLTGFFVFYGSDIDVSCVHCPVTGKMVGKEKFGVPKLNGVSFSITKGLCLQDPFELNRNLSENFQVPVFYKFKQLCLEMIEILTRNDD